jgi:hypothetical protein
MWTLDNGLALVRAIQPKIRQFNYHVAIGGGVVNRGFSTKDLDLYFLPMQDAQSIALRAYLVTCFGPEFCLGGGPEGESYVQPQDVLLAYGPDPVWVAGRFTYHFDGKRIDGFIA